MRHEGAACGYTWVQASDQGETEQGRGLACWRSRRKSGLKQMTDREDESPAFPHCRDNFQVRCILGLSLDRSAEGGPLPESTLSDLLLHFHVLLSLLPWCSLLTTLLWQDIWSRTLLSKSASKVVDTEESHANELYDLTHWQSACKAHTGCCVENQREEITGGWGSRETH